MYTSESGIWVTDFLYLCDRAWSKQQLGKKKREKNFKLTSLRVPLRSLPTRKRHFPWNQKGFLQFRLYMLDILKASLVILVWIA